MPYRSFGQLNNQFLKQAIRENQWRAAIPWDWADYKDDLDPKSFL